MENYPDELVLTDITNVESAAIGRGGFGSVYKAVYQGTPVAIKVINDEYKNKNSDMTMIHLIALESTKMMAARHPCVVRVYGVIWSDLLIVMEYMPGGTLEHYIETHPDMSWNERFRCAKDVAEGMDYLHASVTTKGKKKTIVFHQDLKSANCLLYQDNSKHLRAKISDFGLSEVLDPERNRFSNILKTKKIAEADKDPSVNHMGGTQLYMAPELFQQQPFTKACGVYAFGIILLELVALVSPIEAWTLRYCIPLLNIPNPKLKDLMILCVDILDQKRPLFPSIVQKLDDDIRHANLGKIEIPEEYKGRHYLDDLNIKSFGKLLVSEDMMNSSIAISQKSSFSTSQITQQSEKKKSKRVLASSQKAKWQESMTKSSFLRVRLETRKQRIIVGFLIVSCLTLVTALVVRYTTR